ncbi:MAG: hypothetical protein ACKVOM_07125 [Ferruginibacter sp.]
MTIGAHITSENIEQNKLLEALKILALNNTDTKIIFFAEKVIAGLPFNCLQISITPQPKNKLLLYYWYNYKLPKLLTCNNVDSFIGHNALPNSVLGTNGFLFLNSTQFLKENNLFFKKQFKNAASSSKKIFVTDEFIADKLNNKFENAAAKTETLNFNVNLGKVQFTFSEKEAFKQANTAGFDYYLFPVNAASARHLLVVLKAFSQLKRWQKTAIKLLLLFENKIDENLLPDFKNYKYRNDVTLLKQTLENDESVKAAAFAFIFLNDYYKFDSVHAAFFYNVPVIAAKTTANEFLFATAVAYTVITAADVALQLQLVYKNEAYKNSLTQQATTYLQKYDTNKASKKLYELVSN